MAVRQSLLGVDMKYVHVPNLLRWTLTPVLLMFSYRETGPATTMCLILLLLTAEAAALLINMHKEAILNLIKLTRLITKAKE